MTEKKKPEGRGGAGQLPLYAKFPRSHANHPGLFVRVESSATLKERGSLLLEGASSMEKTPGFKSAMELSLPEKTKSVVNGNEYTIIKAMLVAQGPQILGANELRTYHALIGLSLMEARANRSRAEITLPEVVTPRAVELRARLGYGSSRNTHPALAGLYPAVIRPILDPHVITLRTSLDAVVRSMGLKKSQTATESAIAGLRALAGVTIVAQFKIKDKTGRSILTESTARILDYRMISEDSEDARPTVDGKRVDGRLRNRLEISFDPSVTDVLRNDPYARYSLVDLEETRELGDVALLLHNRLCGILDHGRKLRFGVNKLVSYVYPIPSEGGSVSAETIRKYRKRIVSALDELRQIRWDVVQLRPGTASAEAMWQIGRPARKGRQDDPTVSELSLLAGGEIEIGMDAPSLDPDAPSRPRRETS